MITNSSKRESGNVLFELALTLPMILGVLFLGLEVARTIHGYQKITYLAREVGREAFNRCARSLNQAVCINDVALQFNRAANVILPGSQIVITMYGIPPAAPAPAPPPTFDLVGVGGLYFGTSTTPCTLAQAQSAILCNTPANSHQPSYNSIFLERYRADKIKFKNDFAPVITSMHPMLAVAEVYYLQFTILPVRHLLFLNYVPGVLYETAIF